jgi:uncharacterized membrane protein
LGIKEAGMAGDDDQDKTTCALCGKAMPRGDAVSLAVMRPDMTAMILADHPDMGPNALICRADLARYRRKHLEHILTDEAGRLSALDREVIDALASGQVLTQDPGDSDDPAATSFGERMSDRVAAFGGSWTFIIGFVVTLVAWMLLNVTGLVFRAFDPYPFIFLNLILSCVAALQAPIILMSQRRQDEKDRIRAESDYRVNLKSELEIRALHEKIDHQWEHLLRIQRAQSDLVDPSDAE